MTPEQIACELAERHEWRPSQKHWWTNECRHCGLQRPWFPDEPIFPGKLLDIR